MVGVFAYVKAKIKHKECEFPCCAKVLVAGVAHVSEDVVGNYDWDGDLWLGGWVAAFVGSIWRAMEAW